MRIWMRLLYNIPAFDQVQLKLSQEKYGNMSVCERACVCVFLSLI